MDAKNRRIMNFKQGVKQKTSAIYSKLGRIKNAIVDRIKSAKDKVVDFTTTKIADHYIKKEEKEIEKAELESLKKDAMAREAEIAARTEEHKIGMKEALKEQDRLKRQERIFNFKEGVKQKTTTLYGKLGRIKNSFVDKIRPSNLDVKFRNMVEEAQIAGLSAVAGAKDFVETKVADYYLKKEEKELERAELESIRQEEMAREAEIAARTEEHKIGMMEALKEQERIERLQRVINFKLDMKQKASSLYSKLGRLNNSLIDKMRLTNIDVKLRNAIENAEIAGLTAIAEGKDYIATKAADYYLKKEELELERAELESVRQEELAREAEIAARTEEHKIGMKEALKEQDRLERQQRLLNFKQGVKQKTSSVFSKLGRLKNAFISKLMGAKDKVVDFATTKIAEHYLKKEDKQNAKAFREAAKLAEKQELEMQKNRIKERKSAMIAALSAQEREMYEQKHLDNMARREELMTEVFGERESYEVSHAVRAL